MYTNIAEDLQNTFLRKGVDVQHVYYAVQHVYYAISTQQRRIKKNLEELEIALFENREAIAHVTSCARNSRCALLRHWEEDTQRPVVRPYHTPVPADQERERERERERARESEREGEREHVEVLCVRLWCHRANYHDAQLAKNT